MEVHHAALTVGVAEEVAVLALCTTRLVRRFGNPSCAGNLHIRTNEQCRLLGWQRKESFSSLLALQKPSERISKLPADRLNVHPLVFGVRGCHSHRWRIRCEVETLGREAADFGRAETRLCGYSVGPGPIWNRHPNQGDFPFLLVRSIGPLHENGAVFSRHFENPCDLLGLKISTHQPTVRLLVESVKTRQVIHRRSLVADHPTAEALDSGNVMACRLVRETFGRHATGDTKQLDRRENTRGREVIDQVNSSFRKNRLDPGLGGIDRLRRRAFSFEVRHKGRKMVLKRLGLVNGERLSSNVDETLASLDLTAFPLVGESFGEFAIGRASRSLESPRAVMIEPLSDPVLPARTLED